MTAYIIARFAFIRHVLYERWRARFAKVLHRFRSRRAVRNQKDQAPDKIKAIDAWSLTQGPH
jgi:hypothetical protein